MYKYRGVPLHNSTVHKEPTQNHVTHVRPGDGGMTLDSNREDFLLVYLMRKKKSCCVASSQILLILGSVGRSGFFLFFIFLPEIFMRCRIWNKY